MPRNCCKYPFCAVVPRNMPSPYPNEIYVLTGTMAVGVVLSIKLAVP
jgi:hypothetical protein